MPLIPVAVIRQVFYIIAVTYIGLTDLKGTVLVIRNARLHRLLVIILGIVIGKILIKKHTRLINQLVELIIRIISGIITGNDLVIQFNHCARSFRIIIRQIFSLIL